MTTENETLESFLTRYRYGKASEEDFAQMVEKLKPKVPVKAGDELFKVWRIALKVSHAKNKNKNKIKTTFQNLTSH